MSLKTSNIFRRYQTERQVILFTKIHHINSKELEEMVKAEESVLSLTTERDPHIQGTSLSPA